MWKLLLNIVSMSFVLTSHLPMTSSINHYTGDVRIFIDQSAFVKWKNITGKTHAWELIPDIFSNIMEVNEILKTMERYNTRVQMKVKDMLVFEYDILNTYNGKIDKYAAAEEFAQWLKPTYQINSFCVAFLYTGADLVISAADDDMSVVYRTGSACSPAGVAIIQATWSYADVLVTAHNIGHMLGAVHDGDDGAQNCRNESGEISNSHIDPTDQEHYYFSQCAADRVSTFINNMTGNNTNCLATSDTREGTTGQRYASLTTPDEICQREHGAHSFIFREKYASYGDEVCSVLVCALRKQDNTTILPKVITPEGLVCGKNKVCIRGKCVRSRSSPRDGRSPYVSDTCPFGDQPEVWLDDDDDDDNGGGGLRATKTTTCAHMDADKCLKWHRACCHTCRNYSWNPDVSDPGTADEICRHLEGSQSVMRRFRSSHGNDLCSRLPCVSNSSITDVRFYKAPDGMKCGNNKRCYNGRCIFSLHSDVTMPDRCPYGDQPWFYHHTDGAYTYSTTCQEYIQKFGCDQFDSCCGSCVEPGDADEECRRLAGKSSALARRAYATYGDNLCARLTCLTDVSGVRFFWKSFKTPDGLKCGKGKVCKAGKCVLSFYGDQAMSDWCPYGDQPWLGGSWRTTCQEFSSKNGCGDFRFRWDLTCCNTCNN